MTFGVDHVVSGVAINILAAGVARFLSELLYTDNPAGGGVTQSPALSQPAAERLAAGALLGAGPARRRSRGMHWFLISDVAGVLRGRHQRVGVLTIAGRAADPGVATCCCGARRSACGCARAARTPAAADSLGVPSTG